MEEDVRNAVFGNVGTIISFRVGPFDAEVLETIFTPQFLATDIVNLGFAQVYTTLMIDGIGSSPFSATTLPSIAPQSISYKDMVIASSRKTFARPRADVEADIVKFHEPVIVPKKESPRRVEEERAPRKEVIEEKKPLPQKEEAPRERRDAPVRRVEERSSTVQQAPVPPREEKSVPQKFEEKRNAPPPRERILTSRAPLAREERTTSPQVVKKDPGSHLDDLRSILKKVASQGKEEPKAGEMKKDIPVTQLEIKSEQSAPTIPEVPQASSPEVTEKPQIKEHISHSRPAPHGDVVQTRPGITPKELERMMRVTGSDTPS